MDQPVVYLAAAASPLTLWSMAPYLLMGALLIWVVWMGQVRARKTREREIELTPGADRRHGLQRAMEELQVNVMEFGRDVEARLDTKIRTLERLIADADARIKRLEELRGKGAPGAGEIPPIHTEIYRLADQGRDKIEISRSTGIAPGEVELILGLRKTRGSDGGR
jgi:hypothetical protein